MKFRLSILAALIGAATTGASSQEIPIGAPASLTGSYAFVGTAALRGLQHAIDEVNTNKELGAGRSIKLFVADDGSNNNQSTTLVNRLVNVDKVMAIAGPGVSPTVLAVSPVVNHPQVPMLVIAVSTPVNRAGPWSNRILNSPATLMTVLTNYTLESYKPRTVMTVARRDDDGAAGQSKVARAVMDGKATLMPEESALMAETDFSARTTKIATQKPDVVTITMNGAAAANIILQSEDTADAAEAAECAGELGERPRRPGQWQGQLQLRC